MKPTVAAALLAVILVSVPVPTPSQNRVEAGPWRLFRQENPPLSYEEIPAPFVVREIRGTVSFDGEKPLKGAYFEVGLAGGNILATDTNSEGRFELRGFRSLGTFVRTAALRPGTYRFKVTKDGFHSVVGTIVISPEASKESVIAIALKPGEGYREEQPRPAPDEQLLPLSAVNPVPAAPKRKKYPEKYSAVYMPVSLAEGRVRTPEFPVAKKQWYDIVIQVEKPLPFMQMKCMMGVTTGPPNLKYCASNDPLLQADWTVWENEHMVHWGSISDTCGCIFTNEHIFKLVGSFPLDAGKKYVVQVHFTKDGTPLNVANPRLIVIPQGEL